MQYTADRRRYSCAVYYLRVLQLRQVSFLLGRAHEALHGVPFLPRQRNSGSSGFGLHSRAVCPADGYSRHGHAHRLEWRNVGANQRISVDEAVQVNTINGAFNSHEESIKGSTTPGKLADFVVLADDPHIMNKKRIKDIEIVRDGHWRLDRIPAGLRNAISYEAHTSEYPFATLLNA